MAVVKLKANLRQVLNSSEFWYLLNTNTEPNWICELGVELFVFICFSISPVFPVNHCHIHRIPRQKD